MDDNVVNERLTYLFQKSFVEINATRNIFPIVENLQGPSALISNISLCILTQNKQTGPWPAMCNTLPSYNINNRFHGFYRVAPFDLGHAFKPGCAGLPKGIVRSDWIG
ncbi:hypothetical protein H0H93_001375, partial [Arthromyces matolae]